MAGVKQFDRNQVLECAIVLLWTRGFEATSVPDVVDATGVGRGSLYATFRDKNRLFLTVVDHYLETVARSCG